MTVPTTPIVGLASAQVQIGIEAAAVAAPAAIDDPGSAARSRVTPDRAGEGRAQTAEWGACMRSRRVVSPLSMSAFDPSVNRVRSHDPTPPMWRMHCLCSFRAGKPGEIAVCECRCWWRVSRRGRWYAISRRRAFRALLPELRRELSYFEEAGGWPPG
jgi:hypothetical protein